MSRSLFAQLARRFRPRPTDQVRRDMLRATLLAGSALLLSGPRGVFAGGSLAGAGRRVVVIGGGFSGLACAHELLAAGYDVTVLEARNRLGGRVLSFGDFVAGRNVEGGAELVGANHPTWVAYADAFGLEFIDVTGDEDMEFPIHLGGERLDADAAEKLYKQMEAAYSTMNPDAEGVDADRPWLTPEAEALDALSVRDWLSGIEADPLAKLAIAAELSADNAVPIERQSYLGQLALIKGGGVERYWTDSEVYRCRGGNQQLAFRLAEAIGASRILTGVAVSAVTRRGAAASITTGDGRTFEADHVVLAVPPSVWGRIRFSPGIPADFLPQMGTATKHLSAVRGRFWRDAGLSQYSLTDGEISMTWDATDNQQGDGPACLTGFSGGPAAERLRARMQDDRAAACTAQLEGLYPGYAANLTDTRYMDWPGDPWAGAAYSFPAPGEVTRVGPRLHKGLGCLHFAGEHTCYKFVGYMEGALNSGVALARRIAESDGVLQEAPAGAGEAP